MSEPTDDVPLPLTSSSDASANIESAGTRTPRADRPFIDTKLLFFFFAVVVGVYGVHSAADAHFDFGVFYYAAHMVLDGSRHALYNIDVQHAFQARLHRPSTQLFYGLPCTLLPYLPVAELPIQIAFIAWTIISLALVYWTVRLLREQSKVNSGNWPIILAIAFMPVAICLAHGQLSILILAIYVFTYAQWLKGHRFRGGVLLSLALLKYQLVVGFVAVLLVKRKWRELAGFMSGAIVLLALSAWIVGIPSLMTYPNFVLHNEGGIGSEPGNMASLRGFLSLFGSNHPVLLLVLSALTILWAAWSWKDLEFGYSASVLASMLASYHFNPQDLSLCLIPFFLGVKAGIVPEAQIPQVAFLGLLAPMILAATGAPFALLALLLAGALYWISRTAASSPSSMTSP